MMYSIVDSVKGGSGKTCFSLHLCLKKHLDEMRSKGVTSLQEAVNDIKTAEINVDKAQKSYDAAVEKYDKYTSENASNNSSIDKLKTLKDKAKAELEQCKKKLNEAKNKYPAQPLYFDMDIMGSSIESILWGDRFVGTKDINGSSSVSKWNYNPTHNGMDILPYEHNGVRYPKRASRYLNDIVEEQYLTEDLITSLEFVIGYKDDANTIKDLETNEATKVPNIKAWVDMIISDPSYTVKSKFRGNSDNTGEINVGEFRYQMHKLLKIINKSTEITYKDIVFDMPPGGDRYSECLYDILLKKEEYSIDSGNIDIYHMTTLDNSHIDATVERVVNFYNSRIHVFTSRINNIYIVLNNTIGTSTDIVEKRRTHLIKKLDSALISQSIRDKIKIMTFDFVQNYRSVVCGEIAKDVDGTGNDKKDIWCFKNDYAECNFSPDIENMFEKVTDL